MKRIRGLFAAVVLALCAFHTSAFVSAPPTAFTPARGVTCPRTPTELGVRIKIDVGDGEPIESAIRRFKREVNKSGHLMELRHKRYFESTQEKRKRKIQQARQRRRFERMQKRRMANRT